MKFGSKYLKHNKEIIELLYRENFKQVEFYGATLEVSENWLKINGTYLPKNFIVATYDLIGADRLKYGFTKPFIVHFILITGEYSFSMSISYKMHAALRKDLYILKEYLPNAIITDKWILSGWKCYHRKKLVMNFKRMMKEMGIVRLIYEWQDIYKQFSMDGVMNWEVYSGRLVDIEIEGDTSGKYPTGKFTTGKIDKVLDDNSNAKGCLVQLQESGLVGRVKKVYGKEKIDEYKLDDRYKD